MEKLKIGGADSSASDISDHVKDVLFAKTAERIEGVGLTVGASMFGDSNLDTEEEQDG